MRLTTTLLTATLLATLSIAARADDTPNPDVQRLRPLPQPHPVIWELSAGAGVTLYPVSSDSSFAVPHAHFNTVIGVQLSKHTTVGDPMTVGLGYAGSADVNDAELFHRHGFGILIRDRTLFAMLSAGVTFGHDFGSGMLMPGGHVAVDLALRAGPVHIGMPFSLDFVGTPYGALSSVTLAATLGVQL